MVSGRRIGGWFHDLFGGVECTLKIFMGKAVKDV